MAGEAPQAPSLFWVAFTAASALGATRLVLALASIVRRRLSEVRSTRAYRSLWLPSFLVVVAAVYCVPFGYYGPWFDRYLLLEMSLLGLLLAVETTRSVGWQTPSPGFRLVTAATLALVSLGFGIGSAHDYLAWNRARWEAGRSLMVGGEGAPDGIDGGFEFDNYFALQNSFDTSYSKPPEVSGLHSHGVEVGSQRRFVIALSELPGFTSVRRVNVDSWMPLSPDEIFILSRAGR
jgi:hypothetical protein